MKIKIRHRTDFEKVIFGIFIVVFGEGILSIFVPQIHPVYYLVDLLNTILFVGMIKKRLREKQRNSYLDFFYFLILLYIILAVIGAIVNYSNIMLQLLYNSSFFCRVCII